MVQSWRKNSNNSHVVTVLFKVIVIFILSIKATFALITIEKAKRTQEWVFCKIYSLSL